MNLKKQVKKLYFHNKHMDNTNFPINKFTKISKQIIKKRSSIKNQKINEDQIQKNDIKMTKFDITSV